MPQLNDIAVTRNKVHIHDSHIMHVGAFTFIKKGRKKNFLRHELPTLKNVENFLKIFLKDFYIFKKVIHVSKFFFFLFL